MIVMEQPSALRLFVVMQGSVVPRIIGKIIGVALLSALILLIDLHLVSLPHVSISAMGVFGIALSLFLGFRNNAAYDRWWEARLLWGAIVGDVRNLARHTKIFGLPDAARENILSETAAFAHLLRGSLRGDDVSRDVRDWVGHEPAAEFASKRNPPDAALRSISARIGETEKDGAAAGFGQMTIAQTLAALGNAQAGCERIATTPLPFVYSLLVRRTTYLYCFLLPFALIESTGWFTPVFAAVVAYVFFGLQAVTNELERPFANVQNGLALNALCRVIDISVAEALGREPPEPLATTNSILS
ncbi:bestrophin family protein [Hoeflea prorocentri]|uniref:Bestrophin family ion channel n=1 Tax=Hoeflea prorocentri TaxID=1922333 RepID=A0A9X3ZHT2_9HYPH|nr:bestrophin family ion channel [Hoeflea prorocentri]MCY6381689.1 bestrophin family ion channel [Hoeflea prorocentri]MDA5399489.1 bestrophin family ion channel [Hoeflea prorocentri]